MAYDGQSPRCYGISLQIHLAIVEDSVLIIVHNNVNNNHSNLPIAIGEPLGIIVVLAGGRCHVVMLR